MKGNLSRLGIMAAAAALMGSAASAKEEEVKEFSKANLPELDSILPLPKMITPPDVFGRYYVGSTQWRNNHIQRKKMAKRSR